MNTKNIPLSLFLCLITFGIYGLYWLYILADSFEKEQLSENIGMSPGILVLVSLVSCGLVNIFVFYKWGRITPELLQKYDKINNENRILVYILFSLFGLSIINLCLIQDDFNKIYSLKTTQDNPSSTPIHENPPPASYR